MSNIILGTRPDGTDLYLPNDPRGGNWGFYLIKSFAGGGKTLLMKNIISQCKDNYVLIFDFNKEHSLNNSPNIHSRDNNFSNFLPRLKTINNPTMDFKSFKDIADWVSLGITENGALCILNLIPKAHDFKDLYKMVINLPSSDKERKLFFAKYGFSPPLTHKEIKNGLERRLKYCENIFDESGTPIDNPAYLLKKHKHLCINLGLNEEIQEIKGRFFVGKFLEKLKNSLPKFKGNLYLFFEEGDMLIPNLSTELRCSSSRWIDLLVTKWLRRNKIRLFLITQFIERLDPIIVNKYSFMISYQRKKDLKKSWWKIFDMNASSSQFDNGYYRFFYPKDCSVLYENSPEVLPRQRRLILP